MEDFKVTFSIIIPVKPGRHVAALAALRGLEFPQAAFEILVAEGCRPSVQRNRAAAQAAGTLLYFLDDDSLVDRHILTRIAAAMNDPAVAVIGGPSVTPSSDSTFQRTIGYMLQTFLGGGGVRNRYRSIGVRRITNERELILCNLCFRRDLFLAHGGLDERLYPNEENELLDRLQSAGHSFMHDPQMAIVRSQRPTVRSFVRQMYGYGVGRGEQTRIGGRLQIDSLIPPLFLIYLVSLVVIHVWWYVLPLVLYLLLIIATAIHGQLTQTVPGIGVRLCIVIPALHLLYGAGIMAGAVSPRFRADHATESPVVIRYEKRLGEPWCETTERSDNEGMV
jgi:hypothetical protein